MLGTHVKKTDLFWRDSLKQCSPVGRRAVAAVLGSAFFSTLGVGAYTFALSLTAGSSGLSPSWLGLAFSGYFLARLMLAPVAGYCADYIGAVPLVLGAAGLGALSCVSYILYPSLEFLGLIQICLGFCSGIIKPVSMSILGEYAPESKRGRLFGAYNSCLYASFVLGPLLGGAVVKLNTGIGLTTVLIPATGMGISFLLFLPAVGKSLKSGKKKKKEYSGFRWRDPGFISLLLAVFGRTLGASVVIAFLPRLLSERFLLGAFSAGILFALPNVAILIGMPFTSGWADTRDKRGLTFLGMGLCSACLFGYGQAVPLWVLVLLVAMMGFGSALSLPASMSLAADMGPSKGSVMGIFLGVSNLGFVLGPGLAGFAAEYGSISDSFELAALVGGMCLLPIFLLLSKRLNTE
jgi:thiamine biosynthesis lipoprotein